MARAEITITKSKFSGPKLRAAKLFNGYECASLGSSVWISYVPDDTNTRTMMYANFKVIGVGFKTDPNGHWRYQGSKTFSGNLKSNALNDALEWCRDKYGIKSWVKVHGNNWITAEAYVAVEKWMKSNA